MKHEKIKWIAVGLIVGALLGCQSPSLENSREQPEENIIQDLGYGFTRENGKVYLHKSSYETHPKLDAETFEVVGDVGSGWLITKDKNHVYSDGSAITGADPETFYNLGMGYSRDKNHLYHIGGLLEGVDPDRFMMFAKSGDQVLIQGRLMPNLDLSSFTQVSNSYFKDKNAAYHRFYYECYYSCPPMKIEGSDGVTFEVINEQLAKDKNHVYYLGVAASDVDAASFEVISNQKESWDAGFEFFVAKDKNHVFYSKIENEPMPILGVLPEADPSTFKMTGEMTGEDSEFRYEFPSGNRNSL